MNPYSIFFKLIKRIETLTAVAMMVVVILGTAISSAMISAPICVFAQESGSKEGEGDGGENSESNNGDTGGSTDDSESGNGGGGDSENSEENSDNSNTASVDDEDHLADNDTVGTDVHENNNSFDNSGQDTNGGETSSGISSGADASNETTSTDSAQVTISEESEGDNSRGAYVDSAYSSSGGTGYWKNFSASYADPETALQTLKNGIEEEYIPSNDEGDRWSAYWIILTEEDRSVGINSSQVMKAGDLIELFIMAAVYSQISLDRGVEETLPDEKTYELIYRMVVDSDADAADELVTEVLGEGSLSRGIVSVNKFLEDNHFQGTSMGRLIGEAYNHRDNYTTAYDCAKFMRSIYEGKLVSETASRAMLDLLQLQNGFDAISDGIEGYNASSVETIVKYSEMDDEQFGYITNSCAIVCADKNDYVMVVMSDHEDDVREQVVLTITDLSRETYWGIGTQSRFLPLGDKEKWDDGADIDLPYDTSTERDEEFVRALLEYACYWDGCIPYASSQNGTDPDNMRFDRLYKGGRTDCSWFVYHVFHKFGLLSDFVHSYEWGNNPGCYPGAHNIGSNMADASPGDILCLGDGTKPQNSHVAIYIGNGMQVECGGTDGVKVHAAPSHVRQIVHFDCLPE